MGRDEEEVEVFEPTEHPEQYEGKIQQSEGEDYEDLEDWDA